MRPARTRLISFAGTTLSIEYSDPTPAKIIDFLFGTVRSTSQSAPQLSYGLVALADRAGHLNLYREGRLIYEGDSVPALADLLLGDTCHQLALHSRGGLLFHAAGLAWHGKGLMLPGTMGVGKSTLTAWLLSRGFDYLSDELVFIPEGSNRLQAFSRPLNLKRPSRTVLQALLDFSAENDSLNPAADDGILSSSHTDLVPPGLLRPDNTISQPPLRLMIFPGYQPEAEFKIEPLSKAQAGLALLQCLVNARNLPGHGFAEAARLARQTPAYRIHYRNFDQIGAQIETLMGQGREEVRQ